MQLQLSPLLCFQATALKTLFPPRPGPSFVCRATHFSPPSQTFSSPVPLHPLAINNVNALLSIFNLKTTHLAAHHGVSQGYTTNQTNRSAPPYLLCFILLKYKDRRSNGRFFCKERNNWVFFQPHSLTSIKMLLSMMLLLTMNS